MVCFPIAQVRLACHSYVVAGPKRVIMSRLACQHVGDESKRFTRIETMWSDDEYFRRVLVANLSKRAGIDY